ncbi:hypothetical protein GGR57DRAFT_268557 [Xylariaceae sp. FL1272]|nr:hypothetical protein GGR57DRAFT_268557 [Xylariaceae sp. FL1272]
MLTTHPRMKQVIVQAVEQDVIYQILCRQYSNPSWPIFLRIYFDMFLSLVLIRSAPSTPGHNGRPLELGPEQGGARTAEQVSPESHLHRRSCCPPNLPKLVYVSKKLTAEPTAIRFLPTTTSPPYEAKHVRIIRNSPSAQEESAPTLRRPFQRQQRPQTLTRPRLPQPLPQALLSPVVAFGESPRALFQTKSSTSSKYVATPREFDSRP